MLIATVALIGLGLPIGWARTPVLVDLVAGHPVRLAVVASSASPSLIERTCPTPCHAQVRTRFHARLDGANTIPPGLQLEPESGLLVGTPTTPGTYGVTVVSDADKTNRDEPLLRIRVRPAS